jgi:peptidyl-prolyl cis-trans isomerase A (cyclophilin A)
MSWAYTEWMGFMTPSCADVQETGRRGRAAPSLGARAYLDRSCARSRFAHWLFVASLAVGAAACKSKPEKPPAAGDNATQQAPSASAPSGTAKSGKPETVDGYRLIRSLDKPVDLSTVRVKPPTGWEVVHPPTSPDPHAGKFTLDEATKGLDKKGSLATQIETSMGSFYCDLFPDKAPNSVANFIGLARGLRKFWDAEKRAWTARPYYDRTSFNRVLPGFMIQGGDHTGTGRGSIGYMISDELSPGARHDSAGQLCMANRGKNKNEAQFFITEAAAPHLDGSYTIFGQCEPATLVQRIARVPQEGPPTNTPLTPVKIERVKVRRVVGGAAAWMPASAKLPPLPGVPPPGKAVQVPAQPAR